MKTGNLKKILSIVIISIVLALTIATIILAVVPKTVYDPLNRDFSTMSIWRAGINNTYIKGELGSDEQNEVINDILELHEKSLKDNVLSSMFQGTGKYTIKIEDYGYSDVRTTAKTTDVISIAFSYKTEQRQTFTDEEGKVTIKYTRAVMVLNKSESFEECTIYFCDDDYESSQQVTFIAHQSELWDYITKIDMSQSLA